MRLYSRHFEKQLRRDVLKAVRSSPQLKREARRQKFRKQFGTAWLLRPLLAFGLGSLVWTTIDRTQHLVTGLAVASLWAFVWVFVRAQNLLTLLYRANDLPALSLLPATYELIFRWEFSRFRRLAWISLLDLLAAFGAVALFVDYPANWVAMMVIAVGTWSIMFALAMFCAARFPRLPYPLISAGFVILAIGLFFVRSFVANALLAWLDRNAWGINLFLPTGWASSLFLMLGERKWTALGLLVPIIVVLCTIRNSLDRLKRNYSFVEGVRAEAPDLLPGRVEAEEFLTNAEGELPRVGLTAIEEIISSRMFLALPNWRSDGQLEKFLWKWLGNREKALVEFVFPGGIPLSISWKRIFRSLTITMAAAALVRVVSPTLAIWITAIGLFVSFCQMLASVLASGTAFQPIFCSGVNIPLYAAYGIGHRELSRLLFKVSAVQSPLVLLFMLGGSLFVAWMGSFPLFSTAVFGFKAAGLLLASRFIFVTFSFSSGTNDSAGFSFRTLVLLSSIIAFGGFFLLTAGAGLLVPDARAAWTLWAVAFLDAYAFFRIYGGFYHRSRFDLMSLPRK